MHPEHDIGSNVSTDTPAALAHTSALAVDPEDLRRLGYRAVDLAVAHLVNLVERPVFQPMTPDERRDLLGQPLPGQGVTPDHVLDQVRDTVLTRPMGNGHPRFFGWINSPPAPLGILADLLAAALNPSCAGGDHAAIYLERCAVRWLMELVGFPVEGSMGLLTSGGSMATLTCLAAARQRAFQEDGRDVRTEGVGSAAGRYTLYLSDEGHSSVRKAIELLGLGATSIRTIPTDRDFRIDVKALRHAIVDDRAAGRRPFAVVASAGTVGTGAIDPLDSLADLCHAERLWLHVDGAYGGIGILDPAVAEGYAGLGRADSLILDPHKWLSVPVECGCALVRDGALLQQTFSLVPPYLQTREDRGFGGLPWFSEYDFQQTRGFRALKLWMTLLGAGRDGIAAHIARHNRLARRLADLVDAASDLERLAPVTLSIVCFRYAPVALRGGAAALDDLNRQIMEEVQAGGETFITQTQLRGRFALRACIVHYATTEDDLALLVDVVRRTGARLLAGPT
ncbi:MAG: amino acid decarboxylase [Chloroflexi bacterium]|nr:amino acid decarboxylase [Chloroflexota bacterium]